MRGLLKPASCAHYPEKYKQGQDRKLYFRDTKAEAKILLKK